MVTNKILIHKIIGFVLLCVMVSSSLYGRLENQYKPQKAINNTAAEISFWENKLSAASISDFRVNLAKAHQKMWSLTADIYHLRKAEFILSANVNESNRTEVTQMLAQNLITQHKFCKAIELINTLNISGNRNNKLILFDLRMELGDYSLAYDLLKEIVIKKDFDALIRWAKWEDYRGNLDAAINLLEMAKDKAIESNNNSNLSWAYSNLGDFYGHAGEIIKSKEYFLNALKVNPADWYSMKGIAYIEYAANNNISVALSLLESIKYVVASPSISFLYSEITSASAERELYNKIAQPEYGRMYNLVIAEKLIKEGVYSKAYKRIMDELNHRPTPEVYASLANYFYHNGEIKKARNVLMEEIMDKSYEPSLLLLQLKVMKEDHPKYNEIVEELETARFELGPKVYQEFKTITDHT